MTDRGQDDAPTSQTEPASDPAGVRDRPSSAHRVLHVLIAVLVVFGLPAVLMGVLVGGFGVWAVLVGLLLGVVGSKLAGTRRMLFVAPLLGLAAGLGGFTAYEWWWAGLLASTGVIAGAGAGFGWFAALLMVPYAATFVVPVSSGIDAVIYGTVVGIAGLYGVVVARRFSAPALVDGWHVSPAAAAGVALMFGVVLGSAAAIGVALDWTEPTWVPEPILVLVLYLIVGRRDRIQGKAIGTALGAIAAIPVALLDPPAGVLAAVGTVGIVVAFARVKTYWRMYALYTFSLVLLLAAPNQVGYEAEERGAQVLAGIGLLVVGLFILHAAGRWLEDHHPQPELVEPAA